MADVLYEPIFCSNCEATINQIDTLEVSTSSRPSGVGGNVGCGWCHGRHSIEQVKVCRQLAQRNQEVVAAEIGAQLYRLYRDTRT